MGETWYRNKKYTAEFLIEGNVDLSKCYKVSFINHRDNICRLNGSDCPEMRREVWDSASYIVGYLIGSDNIALNSIITPDIGLPGGRPSTTTLNGALCKIYFRLAGKPERFTGPITSGKDARRIVHAAIFLYALGNLERAKRLVSLLKSDTVFEDALVDLARKHFDLPKFSLS